MDDRRLNRRHVIGASAAATTWLAGFRPARADDAKPSDAIWTSSFKDLTDTVQPLAQWRGKTTVVYFFATWCVPCHIETPKLVKLYDTFKGRDLIVIGIALDNADKTRGFAQKYGIDYPVVYGGREAVQLGRDLGNDLGAIPFTVVIDKAGQIVETVKGDTPDGKLESVIRPLVG